MFKEEFEIQFSFTQEDVIKFAEASGDNNPIHLDDDFAENSIFNRKIIHGFLGASVFSKVFGTLNPGIGTIYLKQNLTFLKPMYIETEYLASFVMKEKYPNKNRALVDTLILDMEKKIVIKGEALIQHEKIN